MSFREIPLFTGVVDGDSPVTCQGCPSSFPLYLRLILKSKDSFKESEISQPTEQEEKVEEDEDFGLYKKYLR